MFKQFNINSTLLFTFFGFFTTKIYLFLKNILESILFILRFSVEAFLKIKRILKNFCLKCKKNLIIWFSHLFVVFEDIDECFDLSLNNCSRNAQCTNLSPGFSCSCDSGYTGNGFTCTGIADFM